MSPTRWNPVVVLVGLLTASVLQAESLKVLENVAGTPGNEMLQAEFMRDFEAAHQQRLERYEQVKTAEDVEAYQQRLRELFVAHLGGWPERTPLNARIVGEGKGDGFRYQKIIYESRPGFHVTAILFLPMSDPPYPGVLVPCGHSATGKGMEAYQRASILLARHGMAALCYDPIGQGERHQVLNKDGKPAVTGTREHTLVGQSCILVGTNTATFRIWDGMRGIDYLVSRDDILADRIGCTGNSGGGTLTSFIAALDDRVQCAAASCYITSMAELLTTLGAQDAEQNIHAQLAFGMDHADYLIVRAPKPTLVCAATHDYFSITGTWDSFRQAKRIYARLGVPERMDIVETDEKHGFSTRLREGAVHWMQRWLLDRDENVTEPEFEILTDEQVRCTPEGEVLLLDGARSLMDINMERAARLAETRRAAWSNWDRDTRAAKVRETASIRPLEKIPAIQAEQTGRIDREDYQIRKWVLKYRNELVLPAIEAASARPEATTVLYLHDEGKEADITPGGPIEQLVREGHRVWAVDLSGLGETAPQPRHKSWTPLFGEAWQQFFLAYMLDQSFVGLRTEDILACTRHLNATDEEDAPAAIRMIAHGECAIPALHAAALHPELFDDVKLIRGLKSWESVVSLAVRNRQLTGTIHGVLGVYDLPDLAEMVDDRITLTWESALDETEQALSRSMPEISEAHDLLRKRTATVFEKAAFLKPKEGTVAEELFRLAPLIVQQADTVEQFRPFGHVVLPETETETSTIAPGRKAVYLWEDRARIDDRELRRLSFLWFYPPIAREPRPLARGFRMILDEQRFPIIWESLCSSGGLRVLYVSQALENEAAAAYQQPHTGRSFAIEPSLDQRPDVVVARVLEDGPIPMGPYAYLNDRLEITTILCRCMPAQVDDFLINDAYDLIPIDGLSDLKLDPALQHELDALLAPLHLETALRLS